MMKTKILVLLISLITYGLYLVGKYAVGLGLCAENDYGCRSDYDYFEGVMYFSEAFVAVAIGSFLLKPEYYRAWWKFARLAIPLAVLFLILINLQIFHTNPGGSGGMGDIYNMLFDQLYIFVVYSLFILGSIITVYLAWRKTKKLNAKSK